MEYHLIEKKDPLALHGIFSNQESAERHLKNTIPEYVRKGYFMDKLLTADDFVVVPAKAEKGA